MIPCSASAQLKSLMFRDCCYSYFKLCATTSAVSPTYYKPPLVSWFLHQNNLQSQQFCNVLRHDGLGSILVACSVCALTLSLLLSGEATAGTHVFAVCYVITTPVQVQKVFGQCVLSSLFRVGGSESVLRL